MAFSVESRSRPPPARWEAGLVNSADRAFAPAVPAEEDVESIMGLGARESETVSLCLAIQGTPLVKIVAEAYIVKDRPDFSTECPGAPPGGPSSRC